MKRLTAVLLLVGLAASGSPHGGAGSVHVEAQSGTEAAPAAAANQVSSDGAMGGANLQRTAVYRTKGVSQPQGVAWKSEVLCKAEEDNFYSVPVVAGGLVYVVCGGSRRKPGGMWLDYVHDHGVYALDAGTGKKVWEFKPKRFSLSGLAVAGGLLYVGSRSDYFGGPAGTLYALDAATGRERWSYKSKKHPLNYVSPLVADGTLYFDDERGNFYALDSATGETRWVFKARGAVTAAAILDGTAYFASGKGLAYALDLKTGRQKWERKLPSGLVNNPVVVGGLVYFDALDENLYALGVETGEQALKLNPPGEIDSFLAVADGTIFYGGRDKNFYAVDARTGREKWRLKTGDECDGASIAEGLAYFPCYDKDGTLYAADAGTGEVKWRSGSETLWYYTPSVSEGALYFMMSDGRVYAVR